jgi:ABC-type hemin transport system ATPase subunit
MDAELGRIILDIQQKEESKKLEERRKKAEEEMNKFLISILYSDDRRRLLNIRSGDEQKYCFIARMLQSFWKKSRETQYGRTVFVDEGMNYPLLDAKNRVLHESFMYLLRNVDEIDKELKQKRQWEEVRRKYPTL